MSRDNRWTIEYHTINLMAIAICLDQDCNGKKLNISTLSFFPLQYINLSLKYAACKTGSKTYSCFQLTACVALLSVIIHPFNATIRKNASSPFNRFFWAKFWVSVFILQWKVNKKKWAIMHCTIKFYIDWFTVCAGQPGTYVKLNTQVEMTHL